MIKHPRTFITVTLLLLIVTGAIVVVVWWLLVAPSLQPTAEVRIDSDLEVEKRSVLEDTESGQNQVTDSSEPYQSSSLVDIPFESAADLPLTDGQRALADTVGIDLAGITISPELITCVTAAVGEERYTVIINGQTPTFLEGLAIARCLRQ